MRKAARLFEIIQVLRLSKAPVTAAAIAETLEVSQRTVYRDIVALQAMRVPIEGDRGIGYIMRPGFDLPPLMFSIEETEAVIVGLALIERTGDKELTQAAKKVAQKIAAAVPEPLRQLVSARSLHAWGPIAPEPANVDFTLIRRAIRDEEKLDLAYRDEQGQVTQRIIRPLALIYYLDAAVIVGWCELRQAIRNFRLDRTQACSATGRHFRNEGDALRELWISGWKTRPAA